MSECLGTPKSPEIGIASILRLVPGLLDSPTNAILPPLPPNANTPITQVDSIVARTADNSTRSSRLNLPPTA